MEIKYDSITPITINVGTFLTDRDIILSSDITEIVFYVKSECTDADVDALVTKLLTLSEIVKVGETAITVFLAHTDYGAGKLELTGDDKPYFMTVGFKTATLTKFLEGPLVDDRLVVTEDCIHD